MMNSATEDLIFTMPLTLEAHQAAQQFRQKQSNRKKAKQVYLNTLAVHTVYTYLKWLGIDADLQRSDSWNPAIQTLSDIADLQIEGKGKLECRPVLPDQQTCHVPAEVWFDRIGFVVVQFDASLEAATILGFVPEVITEELPLTQLRSLDELLEHLNQAEEPEPSREFVQIGRWLQGLFEAGWQAVENLLDMHQPALSFRNTSAPEPLPSTIRAKLLDLPLESEGQVALLIGVMPTAEPELDIWARICPKDQNAHLPPDLELEVLDETGSVLMQAQSRSTRMIQMKFSGVPGEKFSIRVTLGDVSLSEAFII